MTNTRKLTTMAILTALSVCFVALIHFPIFPAVAFLEYDPADIPILICGFAFGPAAGFIVTLIAAFIQGFTVSAQSGIYGIIMHIVATGAYVLSSSLFYRNHKTKKMAAVAIGIGTLTMVVCMFFANLVITPYFLMGAVNSGTVSAVLSLSGQVWGYCYTQLTDVEQEQNGIYCYDRSAKFDMDRIKAIFSKRPEHPAR